MVDVPVRVDGDAPPAVTELFGAAYDWALATIPGGASILEVGGGVQRLGKTLLGELGSVTDCDADPLCGNDVTCDAAALPFANGEFDCAVCFETVEHTARPIAVVAELCRVTRTAVLLGSVNSSGPNFTPDGTAIYKGVDNPHHVAEMDAHGFAGLLQGLRATQYGLLRATHPADGYVVVPGVHPAAYVNYAHIDRQGQR